MTKQHYNCWKRQPQEVILHKITQKQPSEVFCKKQRLRPTTLLKKRLWHRCFPVNFAKFLRVPFLRNTSGRLLLITFHWFVPSTSRKRAPWKGHFFCKLAGCIASNLLFHYCMFSSSVSQENLRWWSFEKIIIGLLKILPKASSCTFASILNTPLFMHGQFCSQTSCDVVLSRISHRLQT